MSNLILAFWLCWGARAGTFRFHLLAEPHTMDPQSTASLSGNYLFQNLYRGLFRYDSRQGLRKEGAKDCARSRLSMLCHLNPAQKWSDGSTIKAQDYVAAFRRLIDPERRSPQSELLLTLKNAKGILDGKKPVAALGVSAPNDSTVKFEFDEEDPQFE